MEQPIITDIRFRPVTRNGSLVGFTSFRYKDMIIRDIGVHQRLDKTGYRLVFPLNETAGRSIIQPVKKEITKAIEAEVMAYMDNNGYVQL